MLNSNNQIIARAIASAYCSQDQLCQNSVFTRLNTYFDDNNFASFLSTLQNRAYLIGNFINKGEAMPGVVKIEFKYFDVITGISGSAFKNIPMILFSQNRYDRILAMFVDSLIFVKQNSDNSTLFINPDYGYEIAYTTDPVNPGTGGNGTGGGGEDETRNGGNSTGGGKIIVPSTEQPGQYNTIPVPSVTTGFNYNDLIIPGAIVLGLYFLMSKK